jgi:hypothetical protein
MDRIPFVDVRQGGPVAHVKKRTHVAYALRDACLAPLPNWLHGALSPIDGLAGRWLRRSASHYREELEHIVDYLGFPGAMTMNLSYLFACSTAADLDARNQPRIRRSLDWPFHGLGKCVEVAWQSGPAGDYFNVTWPGSVGVLSAVAPGRFAAVINAAPMKRRTRSLLGLPCDIVLNISQALTRTNDWPPDHLLRYAFEYSANFEEAIETLLTEPVARPALFTITGVRPDEIAVVERTERGGRVLRGAVTVANDWQTPEPGWKARMGHENNVARRAVFDAVSVDAEPFSWVKPPVLNNLTRLVLEMSATGAGDLLVRGYEASSWKMTPTPATHDLSLAHQASDTLTA